MLAGRRSVAYDCGTTVRRRGLRHAEAQRRRKFRVEKISKKNLESARKIVAHYSSDFYTAHVNPSRAFS